jgi:hypothetical protein
LPEQSQLLRQSVFGASNLSFQTDQLPVGPLLCHLFHPCLEPPQTLGRFIQCQAIFIERLPELRRRLDHLRELRPRVRGSDMPERDMSLRNDVLFSLPWSANSSLILHGKSLLGARQG